MIEVSLFVNGDFQSRMKRMVVPSIGETIVIDWGEAVKVVEVSHQWDDPNIVQINCVEVEIEGDNEE